MLVPCRSCPCNLFGFPNNLSVPIYTPGWREALWKLSVLHKNTTQCPQPGLEPEPNAPGMSALTTLQPYLPVRAWWKEIIILYLNQKSPHSLEINSKCSGKRITCNGIQNCMTFQQFWRPKRVVKSFWKPGEKNSRKLFLVYQAWNIPTHDLIIFLWTNALGWGKEIVGITENQATCYTLCNKQYTL